jgi:hypothetical protein
MSLPPGVPKRTRRAVDRMKSVYCQDLHLHFYPVTAIDDLLVLPQTRCLACPNVDNIAGALYTGNATPSVEY